MPLEPAYRDNYLVVGSGYIQSEVPTLESIGERDFILETVVSSGVIYYDDMNDWLNPNFRTVSSAEIWIPAHGDIVHGSGTFYGVNRRKEPSYLELQRKMNKKTRKGRQLRLYLGEESA